MNERYLIEKKFILVTFAIIIATGLLWAGRITGASYENMVIWLTGIFILGEAASGWVAAVGVKSVTTTIDKTVVTRDIS